MNMNLNLATSQCFGTVQCDFWSDNESNDFWITRDQIGTALGYEIPRIAISKIHDRHKERLDKFSGVTKLGTPQGIQEVYIYSFRGVLEICRWSRQAKADEFMDWIWEIIDGLRTGKYKLSQNGSNLSYDTMIANLNQNHALLLQELNNTTKLAQDNAENLLALAYTVDDFKSEMLERTETYDRLISSKGCLSMNQVAKSNGIGRNKMMEILRNQGILTMDGNDNIPYEKYVKSGHFIVTDKTGRNGEIHSVTKATGKGVKLVSDLLAELRKLS